MIDQLLADTGILFPRKYLEFLQFSNGAKFMPFDDRGGEEIQGVAFDPVRTVTETAMRAQAQQEYRHPIVHIGSVYNPDEEIGFLVEDVMAQHEDRPVYLEWHEFDECELWAVSFEELIESLAATPPNTVFTPPATKRFPPPKKQGIWRLW